MGYHSEEIWRPFGGALGDLFTLKRQGFTRGAGQSQSGNYAGGSRFGLAPAPIEGFTPGAGVAGGLAAIGGGQGLSAAAKAATAMTNELEALTADLAIAHAELTGSLADRATAEKQRIQADLAADIHRIQASDGRVEGFMSRDGGKIIPLGQMNALAAGGNQAPGAATVRIELSGDIDARIQQVSGPVAVEVVRATAPSIVNASVRQTFSQAQRTRL